jgi:NAD(P)H-hydrate repair Nnr-like enzyme with NAD(P)H-hydrate dehydratase domain
MIYPIGEKYATRTPYIEILSRFRNTLIEEKVVIVIGYSFRDDPINNAFVDRVTRYRKKKFKIIVVDPDVESIKDYLPDALKQVVTPIKAEFGNNNCGNLIASAIENRPPGDIVNV